MCNGRNQENCRARRAGAGYLCVVKLEIKTRRREGNGGKEKKKENRKKKVKMRGKRARKGKANRWKNWSTQGGPRRERKGRGSKIRRLLTDSVKRFGGPVPHHSRPGFESVHDGHGRRVSRPVDKGCRGPISDPIISRAFSVAAFVGSIPLWFLPVLYLRTLGTSSVLDGYQSFRRF